MYTEAGGPQFWIYERGQGIWKRTLDLRGFTENSEWEDGRFYKLYKESSIYLTDNMILLDRDVT